jgi:hypothetical protein
MKPELQASKVVVTTSLKQYPQAKWQIKEKSKREEQKVSIA